MDLPLIYPQDAGSMPRDKINASIARANLLATQLADLVAALGGLATDSELAAVQASVTALAGVVGAKASAADLSALAGNVTDLIARLARINAGLYPVERPGDNPTAFTASRAGGDPDALAPLDTTVYPVRVVGDGLGVEISGSREVWERTLHAVEPTRLWRGRWRYVRTAPSQDPSGDSIVALVQWYGPDRAPIGNPVQVDAATPAVGGPHEVTAFIGLPGVTGVTIARPAGAVYVRAGLKSYGVEGRTVLTDLHAADVSDIEEAIRRLVPDDALPALSARIDDLVAELAQATTDLAARQDAAGQATTARIARVVSALAADYARADTRTLQQAVERQARAMVASADLGVPPIAPRYLYDAATGLSITADPRVLYCIPVGGQSNGYSSTAGTLIGTTALYPTRALMPGDGFGSSRLHVSDAMPGALMPLVEGDAGPSGETISSSMIAHMIRDLDAALPGNGARFVAFNWSLGGTAYLGLKRGSQPYRRMLGYVRNITALAAAQGCRLVIACMPWIHGETDGNANGDAYLAMLPQLQRDLTADIQAITGQVEPVILLISQPTYTFNALNKYGQRMQQTMLDLGRLPGIRVVGPAYAYPRAPTDNVHHTTIGQNRLGQAFARAALAEIFGLGQRPMEPLRAWFEAPRDLVVEIHTPVEPLVIDTTGDVSTTGMPSTLGFDVVDMLGNYLAIASVTVDQATTNLWRPPRLRVRLAADIAVPAVRLLYAQRRDGAADTDMTNARGCVRDSAAHASLYDGSLGASNGRPDNNWLVHFHTVIQTALPYGAKTF